MSALGLLWVISRSAIVDPKQTMSRHRNETMGVVGICFMGPVGTVFRKEKKLKIFSNAICPKSCNLGESIIRKVSSWGSVVPH